ncbi:MAG: DUF4416 family protein [Verrucomicrobiales bacterium]|jgi:hypothetical protein|nr:DUF4416 family protein [Verrucomicrobiales bacterium]
MKSGVLMLSVLTSQEYHSLFVSQVLPQIQEFIGTRCRASEVRIEEEMPDSYRSETGPLLLSQILIFEKKAKDCDLVAFKRKTLELERYFSREDKRRFNLNPGLLDKRGLWMASHKESSRRTQLDKEKEVWVELQLRWSRRKLADTAWTFAEFKPADRKILLQDVYREVLGKNYNRRKYHTRWTGRLAQKYPRNRRFNPSPFGMAD